ncbi:hypothetical protein EN847_33825, partial [Mesorhizobium sp. M1C.F.Ca.ET.204.01.1.1]
NFSSQADWPGIYMSNAHFNIVTGNTISTPDAPSGVNNFGIFLTGGADNIIADNSFNNTTGGFFCIYQASSTTRNTIHGNIGDGTVDAIVGGDGSAGQSYISDNHPVTNLTTAASNDTTP